MIDTKFWLSFLTLVGLFSTTQVAQAQTYQPSNRVPVSDNTLGTQVSGAGGNFDIKGGVSKGQTLFHSFTDFSVPTSGQANFLNPVGNRDIITRVTGNLFSDINGSVNTNGANFFLINPSGIVFGPNAQLNVGKAFVGSTANSLDLVGGGRTITFGTNPSGDAPLLSVAPNVLFEVSRLNLGGGSGAISNFGTLQTQNNSQYIGLIGGNVTLDGAQGGGKIIAPGGRVDIGGLSGTGAVTVDNQGLVFSSIGVGRSNVLLTNGAGITVRATENLDTVNTFFNNATSNGSSINISANNLNILNSSAILDNQPAALDAGLEINSGIQAKAAGDININTTGKVILNNSYIKNTLRSGAEGNVGDIKIQTDTLDLSNNAIISALTAGKGNAGNIIVTAKNAISSTGKSLITSSSTAESVGNAGNITIDAGSLFLRDGTQIETPTSGQGNAGNITIKVSGAVDAVSGQIASTVDTGAKGNAGNIAIDAGSISLKNGARLRASTSGTGNAGNVTVTAKDAVSLIGGAIFSTVSAGGVGKGGNIDINSGSLSLTDSALLSTSILEASNTQPAGKGDAGNINIKVSGSVNVAGSKDGSVSAIRSTTGTGTIGNGGNLTVDAGSFSLKDSAGLLFSTSGTGNGGNIKITATGDVFIDGKKDGSSNAVGTSAVGTSLEQGAVGTGGNIEINARNLFVTNAARLAAGTNGQGNAGNIKIVATGDVSFDGNKGSLTSAALSQVGPSGVGKGGNIDIDSRNLSVTNGAGLSTTTRGKGDAGSIKIKAKDNIFLDGKNSGVFSTVAPNAVGKGGEIEINSSNLNITNQAQVNTSSAGEASAVNIAVSSLANFVNNGAGLPTIRGEGDAGSIKIKAKDNILLDGKNSGVFSIVAPNVVGKGGEIEINSSNLNITNQAQVSTSRAGEGLAGNIVVKANKIALNTSGRITSKSFTSIAGDLNITVKEYLLLQNNSLIETDSLSIVPYGNGGNITISSPLIIATPGNNDITANAVLGNGGKVNITSQGLFGIQFRDKGQGSLTTNDITASSTFGLNGAVNVSTPGTDPGKDSTKLPNVTTDASNQISQVCGANTRENKLTVTGRGGLPPTANDPLTSDVIWQDARAASPQPVAISAKTNPAKLAAPAVGLVFDGKGKVTLVAAGTQGQPTGTSVVCPPTK
jgi:filamentous hemagglutinin family protein